MKGGRGKEITSMTRKEGKEEKKKDERKRKGGKEG